MADVIKSPLKSRPRLALANPANSNLEAEPEFWTSPEASGRSVPEKESPSPPSLPYPLSGLFALVETHRDYPDSSRKLGEFLTMQFGNFPLEDLMLQVFKGRFPRVWMERFLFILLEVQTSDWQTSAYVLQFRNLKRLLLRVERHKPLNPAETTLASDIIQNLSLSRFTDLERFCLHAVATFNLMQSGQLPVSGDLGLLIYLIRGEAIATGERKHWLESNLGSHEPESVARMTPLLKLLEERTQQAQELAHRLGSYGPILDVPMGLEASLGSQLFQHFRESLARSPELAGLREILALQQAKRIPTRDLIALSSLCRWLVEARGLALGPLDWVRMALEAYDRGHFRLDIAGGLPAIEVLLGEAKVERDGSVVLGNFGENPYASWISRDGLTRPFRSSNPNRLSPDLHSIVLANIHRDKIILKLLENAKVYLTPGLVETVVEGNQSPVVHEFIASRPELHSGAANNRVPISLLRSVVSIPKPLLRSLINPRWISFTDIKSLYRIRETLRSEVAEEIHEFLSQAYSL